MNNETNKLLLEMLRQLIGHKYTYTEDGFLNTDEDIEHLVELYIKGDNDNIEVVIVSQNTKEELEVIDVIDDGVVTCFIQFGVNSVMLNHVWLTLVTD